MAGVQGGWVLRPFTGAAEHGPVEALWLAALQGRWPLLPRAVAMVRDGFFAVGGGRVGFVAVDLAGSIPLVLCHARAPASRDRHRPAQRRAGPAARRRRQHGPRGRRRHGLHLAGRAAGPARGGTPVHHPELGPLVPGREPGHPARPRRRGDDRRHLAAQRPGADSVYGPGRHHQLRRARAPAWKDAAWAAPWWHARRRYCATARPAPATSAGPSASRSTPARIRPGFCLRALPVEGGQGRRRWWAGTPRVSGAGRASCGR